MTQAAVVLKAESLLRRSPKLKRHPDDGWRLAEPYPMSSALLDSFRALVQAICPPPPAPWSPEIARRVELYVRSFMQYMHPIVARALCVAIALLDWAPRFLFVSTRRLKRLDPREAGRVLARLAHARFSLLRSLVLAVRGVILSAYFDQDEVHRALGYSPIPFLTNRLSLRQRLLEKSATKSPP